VVAIFKKDLFEDDALLPLYRDLLGYGSMKPFDCVGTFEESRAALALARDNGWQESRAVRELVPLLEGGLSSEVFRVQRAETVPSRFRLLGMDSLLILGYGREGHASERFLTERYPHLRIGIADQNDGEDYLKKQYDFDITMRTPVISKEKVPGQSVTATQLFFATVPRKNVIGITGSKGKSTTSMLTYLLLRTAGVSAHLVGNIGVPALQYLLESPYETDDLFIYELSSYQLEDLDVSPHIAVVTSLFPEHIDHHGSLEAYYEAKRSIVRFQEPGDIYLHAPEFPLLAAWEESTPARDVAEMPVPFPITAKPLRGAHMRSNVALAYTVASLFGVTPEDAEPVISAFEGLPHRLQLVGTFKGIEFYDDSISTTPESAIAGIRALENVDTIILGGVDRGYRFGELEKEIRERGIRNVVLFPESGEHMLSSEEGLAIVHTADMDEAVRFAYERTAAGKSCLLSPAAPSYNLFTNFEERGARFAEAVKKYGTA
jgi:UDP-N-acetylmuramoylalanine--D-glutamate ligase